MADATRIGSLKEAVENYALKHGIDNIEVLFPDARNGHRNAGVRQAAHRVGLSP